MQYSKKISINKILLVVFSIVIFIYNIKDIPNAKSVTIIADEFGYWNFGAWISGLDWSSVTSYIGYYSFGYGLLLIPLFFLFKDSVVMYQSALILNSFLVVISFFLLYSILVRLAKDIGKNVLILISFSAMFFSNILFFSKTTMSEICCMMIFLLTCRLYLRFHDDANIVNASLLSFCSIFAFFVHQRLIGLTCVSLLYVLGKLFIKKKRTVVLMLIICTILIAIGWNVKVIYQNYYYKEIKNAENYNNPDMKSYVERASTVNDFNGQIKKIKFLFTWNGIKTIIISSCGKIFFLGTESYLLVYFGIYLILKESIREKDNRDFYIYLLINFCMSVFVSSIFVGLSYEQRLDAIFYGRYNEQILVLLASIGCIGIVNKKFSFKQMAWISLVELLLGILIIFPFLSKTTANDFNYATVIGIADLYYKYKEYGIQEVVYIFVLRSIGEALLLQILLWREKNNINYLKIVLAISTMVFMGIYIYTNIKNGFLAYRFNEQETNIALSEVIIDSGVSEVSYYSSPAYLIYADYMQFILQEEKINCYTSLDELQGDLILTLKREANINSVLKEKYTKIDESRTYELWEKIKPY